MFDEKRCILVADDEPKMVRAIKDLLTAKDFYVIEAFDGEEALEKYYEYNTKIDLILLDVMMPKADGYEVTAEIRDSASLVPIVMLTARNEEYDQLRGFDCGVDDYIGKPFSPSLLLARIDAVLRRFGKDEKTEYTAGKITINTVKRKVFVDGNELTLTRREYDLLLYLVINETITFTREQLLDNVWGFEFEGNNRTVDTHIKQLRIKLGDCASYIRTIHCVGYQFDSNAK